MQKKQLMIAISVLAVLALVAVAIEADDNDAATPVSVEWTVGIKVGTNIAPGTSYSGSVPGITFSQNASGPVSYIYAGGTPTTAGTYNVTTSDGSNEWAVTIVVKAASTISYTSPSAVDALTGSTVSYKPTVNVSGSTFSTTTVTGKANASWLSFSTSTNTLTGTAPSVTSKTTYYYSIQATTPGSQTAVQTVSFTVYPVAKINTSVNTAYSLTQNAAMTAITLGGNVDMTWGKSGDLPAGVSLSNGKISGTPTNFGTFVITLKGYTVEGPAQTATKKVTFTVTEETMSITSTAPTGIYYSGKNYTYTPTVNLSAGATWTLSSEYDWLVLSGGAITGTIPSDIDKTSISYTLTATSAGGQTKTQTNTINVEPTAQFTSVPTASCVVIPVYDYADNGDYSLHTAIIDPILGFLGSIQSPSLFMELDATADGFDVSVDWTVGIKVGTNIAPGTSYSGSVPGITFSQNASGPVSYIYASGTPTTAGTYTVTTSNGSNEWIVTITVSGGSSGGGGSTTNYQVSFSISSGSSYGSLNYTSITVPSGTTYSKSGNNLIFKNGSTTLYTVKPTPNSSTSSYDYSFGSWSSTSGTITANKSITCTFTRSAAAPSYSDPVITVGSAGSTIKLTSDVSVTWSISTNSSKASLSSTSGTSTTVTPSNYGYITVKATHNSDSSYYSTVTLNICRIVYNANGGSGTVPSTTYYIQSDSGSHSFSLTSASLSKASSSSTSNGVTTTTSYSYLGWGSSSTATSTISSKSVAYRSTATVYAVFSSSTSTSYSAPTISVGSAGSTITLTSNFSATWSISTNSSKASLSSTSGTSITVTPSNYGYIVVKAANPNDSSKYSTKTLNISSLVYDANGGSGAPSTMYWIQTGSSSHSFTLSGSPTKTGSTFEGWGTSSSATSPVSSVSVGYCSTSTVYAIWSVAEETLTFTSVPTSACVTLPTITYRDDGSYVIS